MEEILKYRNLICCLRLTNDTLYNEVADVIEKLECENRNYKESYESIFKDYQKLMDRVRYE